MTSRLGLRGTYYQKPPQNLIKIDEKKVGILKRPRTIYLLDAGIVKKGG